MYIALSGLQKEDRRCKTLIRKCIPTKNYGVGTGGNVPPNVGNSCICPTQRNFFWKCAAPSTAFYFDREIRSGCCFVSISGILNSLMLQWICANHQLASPVTSRASGWQIEGCFISAWGLTDVQISEFLKVGHFWNDLSLSTTWIKIANFWNNTYYTQEQDNIITNYLPSLLLLCLKYHESSYQESAGTTTSVEEAGEEGVTGQNKVRS